MPSQASPSTDAPPYAEPGPLIAACLRAYLPPEKMGVAAWAAEKRYLNNPGGYVGRYDPQKAPYLTGIMDALTSPDHITVCEVGPGQVGKNVVAENWLGQSIDTDPANMLWFMQTNDAIEAYVKKTINPLITDHDFLRAKQGIARTDDSLKFKRFQGMVAEFLSATPANLINKNVPRIIADEFDAYELEGDPETLLNVRRTTYGRDSKMLVSSHPDLARGLAPSRWTHGIMKIYAASDRRMWWWECPHCGCWSSPCPAASHYMALDYDPKAPLDEILQNTHLACPHNGCLVADQDRRTMNLGGRWLGLGQQIDAGTGEVTGRLLARDTAGFWIVGTMSPFIANGTGIGGLAAKRVEAERNAETDAGDGEKAKRDVVVKMWGFPYDPPRQEGTLDALTLADRADPALQLGMVPHGVRFITIGIDVQGNRFELLARGWGTDRESWVIDHQVIREIDGRPVEPATSGPDWDHVLGRAIDAAYPLADGSGRVMRVRAVGFDTQGEPGVTIEAYAAWSRQRKRPPAADGPRVRMLGLVNGRRVWSLIPLRGASQPGAKNLTVTEPDNRQGGRTRTRGEIPLGVFNPNVFKDGLAAQLRRAEAGPGYVHVPASLRSEQAPHEWFEQLVAETRASDGTWSKTRPRNEVTDLMVMAAVAAHLHAPSRFDWTRPPPWARDWDQNPLVVRPASPQLAQPLAPAGAAAQPPAALQVAARPPQGMTRPPEPLQTTASPTRLSLAQLLARRQAGGASPPP